MVSVERARANTGRTKTWFGGSHAEEWEKPEWDFQEEGMGELLKPPTGFTEIFTSLYKLGRGQSRRCPRAFFSAQKGCLGHVGRADERQNGWAGKGPGEEGWPHPRGSRAELSLSATWGRNGLSGTREKGQRIGEGREAGRACIEWRGHKETRRCALIRVFFFFFNPSGNPISCLPPILPAYHLRGLARNHGNRKHEEMTEMLGGHRASWGPGSLFWGTGSLRQQRVRRPTGCC